MPSIKACKKILFQLALRYGVSPNLLSTRLLDASDKQLMMDGEITTDVLDVAVRCWIECGVPNYADGSSEPFDFSYSAALIARAKKGG